MPDRARLLAGAAGAALLVAAVLVLREPAEPEPGPPPPPDRVTRYVADSVVVPEPGDPPAPPSDVRASPGPRVSWRGSAPGYEVRWPGGHRLVTGPEVQLDGVAPGTPVTVRSVDAYGRWSAPVEVLAPGPRPTSGLTGLHDDFADDSSVRADAPGSLWHLSGYRGCVDIGARSPGRVGLVVDLTCGSDVAVLRSRVPLRLIGGRGRAAVLTDAAGPGGRLTLDLVPGPADRVGAEPAGCGRCWTTSGRRCSRVAIPPISPRAGRACCTWSRSRSRRRGCRCGSTASSSRRPGTCRGGGRRTC
ncbi:hypothetical protein ACFQV2_24535 [Actinokineospora soli]|uniref:Fibronectin type-III domain-containing protein n=1 Tax=Actinokineospora soli TaxID=1048753 RepID=A0ABW2TT41_9PSEU